MMGLRLIDKPPVLYGKGKLGKLTAEIFTKMGIRFNTMDRDSLIDSPFLKRNALLVICVVSESYQSIVEPLIAAGWTDIVSVYDVFEAYPESGITSGWTTPDLTLDLMQECLCIEKLSDRQSRLHYVAFMIWHKYRYDLMDDEIIINPTTRFTIPEVQSVLHDNENIFAEFPGSTLADIEIRKHVVTLIDNFTQPYTYVQLHCEGLELESIEKSMNYLQKHRPIIAATVYHSQDGLWKIERTLMDGLSDYRWYFRLHAYQGQGAILYGIPCERTNK